MTFLPSLRAAFDAWLLRRARLYWRRQFTVTPAKGRSVQPVSDDRSSLERFKRENGHTR